MDGFARKSPGYVAAAAIGIAAAFVREHLVGILAAERWPSWYIPWARAHKHLALELSWVVMSLLPSVLLAVAFGALLAMLLRRASTAFVLIAAGAWLVFDLCIEVVGVAQVCIYPVKCFLEPFQLEPVTSALGMLVPAAALLGYGWVRSTRAGV